jgi:hypothetical protein
MKTLFFMLVLAACSHRGGPSSLSSSAPAEEAPPSWLYSPYDFCLEARELCASGEGENFTQAEAAARVNLASIFEVRLQSELSHSSSSSQSFPWQAQVGEEVRVSIKESVDQVLEAVQIKGRFKQKGLSHALASLDRIKASELLGERLAKVDQELLVLWKNHQRTNMRRIVKLYLERERLNERFSLVSGSPRPSGVSWEEIIKWRESRPKMESLVLKVGQAPEWLKEKLSELLTESGFRLVRADASKALEVQVDSIKEFLNVAGFEKYTFTLTLTSIVGGEKHKAISLSETVTGRGQADALLKVKSVFSDYLENHLSDLHLD